MHMSTEVRQAANVRTSTTNISMPWCDQYFSPRFLVMFAMVVDTLNLGWMTLSLISNSLDQWCFYPHNIVTNRIQSVRWSLHPHINWIKINCDWAIALSLSGSVLRDHHVIFSEAFSCNFGRVFDNMCRIMEYLR